MLQSFANKTAEHVWNRTRTKLAPELQRAALRKLLILDAADDVNDLRVPPGNRLEKLSGDRTGQHSICINQQWRIYFIWTPAGPINVEIVGYH
ncbi:MULTISPECIES: type II toxin-antitoxin system RelE/ParE family toxin [unclassified Rhodococcus (in: high G+C Gram-positive bacteria)]|uniref:type II toxin-antitoxin system RelE/ParE family toxin n=1 Tax=unclassified Rhodococcus (in: high G+C Gram-positive bacteria) TaxID=192944 RepID=UPI0033946E79